MTSASLVNITFGKQTFFLQKVIFADKHSARPAGLLEDTAAQRDDARGGKLASEWDWMACEPLLPCRNQPSNPGQNMLTLHFIEQINNLQKTLLYELLIHPQWNLPGLPRPRKTSENNHVTVQSQLHLLWISFINWIWSPDHAFLPDHRWPKQMHNPKGKSQVKSKRWVKEQNCQSFEKHSSSRGAQSVVPDCYHQKCCISPASDLAGVLTLITLL